MGPEPAAPAVNRGEERCLLRGTRRCIPVTNRLFGEAIEDVDELRQAPGLFRLALGDAFGHAAFHVMFEHREADAVERGLGGGKLLQDVETGARLLHHATDAADLTLDAVETSDEALLLLVVEHVFPRKRSAPITLYAARLVPADDTHDQLT